MSSSFDDLPVLLQVFAVGFPIVVFLFFYLRRRDVYDLHHAILGNKVFQ